LPLDLRQQQFRRRHYAHCPAAAWRPGSRLDPAVLAALYAKGQQARTPLASCRRVSGVNGLSGTGAGGDILPAVHRTGARIGKFSKQRRLTWELGAEPVEGVVAGHSVG
jgi:hypothetical protein